MYRFVTEEDRALYEAFVERHPKGHFLQTYAWACFKTKGNPKILASFDEQGNIRGSMSLFTQRAPILNTCTVYSPRGPVCDDDETVMKELLCGAKEYAQSIGAYQITVDPDAGADDAFVKCLQNVGFSIGDNRVDNAILQPLACYRIDLAGKDEESLMASYHSKTRYSVRASLKSEATWRIGSRDELPVFQALLTQTAQKDGFHVRPIEYLYEMYDALTPERFLLFLIEVEGKAVAGSVLLRVGQKTWHLYGGCSDEHKETYPNYLMQWAMQTWSMEQGCTLYDMRGVAGEQDKTTPLEGLLRFKKRFGGDLVPMVGRMDLVLSPWKKTIIDLARKVKHLIRK